MARTGIRGPTRGTSLPPSGQKPKRVRDYKKEHAQRIAKKARELGVTVRQLKTQKRFQAAREEARGHKNERAEYARREARTRAEHGMGSSAVRRLRRETANHIKEQLRGQTKRPVNEAAIDRRVARMSVPGMAAAREMGAGEMTRLNAYQGASGREAYLDEYPDLELSGDDDDDFGAFWYG